MTKILENQMSSNQLRFALEKLSSGDWETFERFCSKFLVPEFPSLRTTATPSGDMGRDAELYINDSEPLTCLQYSVSQDWKTKIEHTVDSIVRNKPECSFLIYCTSQQIGAKGDKLKNITRQNKINLDIRDREWFCEREDSYPERQSAANELCDSILPEFLSSKQLANATGTPISEIDGRVALVQLALNAEDRQGDRNLTKASFEALVQAIFTDTSINHTITKDEVIGRISKLVPNGAPRQVKELTLSALQRLSSRQGPINHIKTTDEYHLSYKAHKEWESKAATYLLDQQALENQLARAYQQKDESPITLEETGKNLRLLLENLFMENGEDFALIVDGKKEITFSSTEERITNLAQLGKLNGLKLDPATYAIETVIAHPSDATNRHLVRVLDAYTLLAFLQQTPDVQKTFSKVFNKAEIWLDTTAILPLLAETLVEEQGKGPQTTLLEAAWSSGVELFVTKGVIEEINAHLNQSLTCSRMPSNSWKGRIPYIYSAYTLSGRSDADFPSWIQNFKGEILPDQDIKDYLKETYHIELRDLTEIADKADIKLRSAVAELFRERHSGGRDEARIDLLAQNDMVNAVGIIQLRSDNQQAFGYEAWWLTLDKIAFKLGQHLKDQLGRSAPASPVLNPDYFSQLLRLGPLRRAASNDNLPITIDMNNFEDFPPELIAIARQTRDNCSGFNELRTRREVRDALFRAQAHLTFDKDYAEMARKSVTTAIRKSFPQTNDNNTTHTE
jgi:hypothetical protein